MLKFVRSIRNERGSAYISLVVIIAVLFIWISFQLDRVIQNQQTIQYDTGILQAQYVAESGIERVRLMMQEQQVINEPLTVVLRSGTAEVEVLHDPLRIRSVGRIAPDVQQTVTVEVDPNNLSILKWTRKIQP